MHTASFLLLVIGLLGAFDVVWFHMRAARLVERPECRREVLVHIARGVVYAAQFVLVPNVRFRGAWVLALAALFTVDVVIAALDVLAEPESRAKQGGLPPGEYFMHVVLSVLVGAMLHAVAAEAWAVRGEPASIALAGDAHAPWPLRLALGGMALGALAAAAYDAAAILEAWLGRPRPLHVSVRLPTTTAELWSVTHDHVLHPRWDHRFDRITMHDARIKTGTRMTYEKTLLGLVTIRGWGRYQLHAPVKQSTFAFGSDDVRSLIREGVGVWRYVEVPGTGLVELSTSYTYAVRWGLLGKMVDRLVFRRLFQRETERSFARLAREVFGLESPVVLGARGRKRARFVQRAAVLEPAAHVIASRSAAGASVA